MDNDNSMLLEERIKEVQLDLLAKLDEICEKNNLHYYLAFGTCLGALRHKGFIPWDHDIDVLMPIEDAIKLPGLQKEFGESYFVQCKDTDPEFDAICYRLCDSRTTCIEKNTEIRNCNYGISIDIYPYYNTPAGKIKFHTYIWKSYIYKILVAERMPRNHGALMRFASRVLLWLYKGDSRKKKIRKIEKKLRGVPKGKYIQDYFGLDITLFSAITYPREWFGEPRKLEFEGRLFNGATEPEKYMTRRYGDYMKLPPVEDQVNTLLEDFIIDTEVGYKEYIRNMHK